MELFFYVVLFCVPFYFKSFPFFQTEYNTWFTIGTAFHAFWWPPKKHNLSFKIHFEQFETDNRYAFFQYERYINRE